MISFKKICLGLLFFCALSLSGYAQDSTSTDDLTFTEIKPEASDTAVKTADTASKVTGNSTISIAPKQVSAPKEAQKTLWGIFIAGFVGGFSGFTNALYFPHAAFNRELFH